MSIQPGLKMSRVDKCHLKSIGRRSRTDSRAQLQAVKDADLLNIGLADMSKVSGPRSPVLDCLLQPLR